MSYLTVQIPSGVGVTSQAEQVLREAGFGVLESATLFEMLLESTSPVRFKLKTLRKAGIEPSTLAEALRAAGMIVEIRGDTSSGR